jgi:hypothetical protein
MVAIGCGWAGAVVGGGGLGLMQIELLTPDGRLTPDGSPGTHFALLSAAWWFC